MWTQNGVFGPNVLQSVLDMAHYVGSFKEMTFQYETIVRLQWLVFLKTLLSLQIMMKIKIIWIGNVR